MAKDSWASKGYLSAYLIFAFLAIIVLVFQGSFLVFFLVRGMMPDLLLIIVVCLAFLWGEKRGLVAGIIAGLLQDVFFGPALGFYILAKIIPAYFSGMISREITREHILGPMIMVFIATLIHEIIVYQMVDFFWGIEVTFSLSIKNLFLPQALYHFVLTAFIYPLLYRAEEKKIFYPSFKS